MDRQAKGQTRKNRQVKGHAFKKTFSRKDRQAKGQKGKRTDR